MWLQVWSSLKPISIKAVDFSCCTWDLHWIKWGLSLKLTDSLAVLWAQQLPPRWLESPWESLAVGRRLSRCGCRVYLLCSICNLSSLTRDQTRISTFVARQILNHWATREVPKRQYCFQNSNGPSQQKEEKWPEVQWTGKLLLMATLEQYS